MSDNSARARWQALVLLLHLLFATTLIAGDLTPAAAIAARKKQTGGQQHDDSAREKRRGAQTEIVGGYAVPQGTDTFMVYILIDAGKRNGKPVYIQCGGTLIDPSHVLTAAHCVEGNESAPQKFHLGVGQANIRSFKPGKGRTVDAVFRHPAYDRRTFANDVAVLRLTEAVPEEVARPIAIVGPGQKEFDNAGLPAGVAGWGQVSERGPAAVQLRAADLRIVSDQVCGEAYRRGFDANVMICASYRKRDSCYGDSGGPLIARQQIGTRTVTAHKTQRRHRTHHHPKTSRRTKVVPIYEDLSQIGIVSWGRGCAESGSPGVYTRLSASGINAFITDALNR